MALIFTDSFAHYAVGDLLKKWTSAGTGMSTSSIVPPLFSLKSEAMFKLEAVAWAGGNCWISKALGATHETFVCGLRFATPALAARNIVTFLDSDTEHVSIRLAATGYITLTRNGTVLATSTNAISVNTWYHIETKITVGDAGDSPSGRYEVRVNGSATGWIADSGTGQDTRNGGAKGINQVRLGPINESNGAIISQYYADVYVLSSTSAPNDFLGPCRVAVLRPAGVGTTAEWSGNYADNFVNVNDPTGDGDGTFNQSSTAGQTDQYAMTNVPQGTIHAVQHVLMARRDSGGARTIRPVTRIGSTDYNGTTVAVGESYQFVLEPVSVSPATAAAWDDDEVNAAEFGYELVS